MYIKEILVSVKITEKLSAITGCSFYFYLARTPVAISQGQAAAARAHSRAKKETRQRQPPGL